VPNLDGFDRLIDKLFSELSAGENILVHCAGGVGRAGTTASCLLVKGTVDADQAMTIVGAARGVSVPETEQQVRFIRGFAG